MAALDFAFGLRRWRVAQMDAVEVKGLAQLGEGVWVMRVKEGVKVRIKSQWQAVGFEDASQEIKMGQRCFAWVEAFNELRFFIAAGWLEGMDLSL